MAELKLTRSGATPKLFISFKVFCTPGFGKRAKRMGQSDGLSKAFEVEMILVMDSWIPDPAFNITHGSLNGDECVAPSQAFGWKFVCHKVWANEKNFTKPGCSPDIRGIHYSTIRMWRSPSKAHDIGRSNAQLLHLLKVGLESRLEEPEFWISFSWFFVWNSTKGRFSLLFSPTQSLSIP